MKLLIDSTVYLCRQELAFRGHDESISSENRGNYRELVSLMIGNCSVDTQNHYEKIKSKFLGESAQVQNDLITCVSTVINDFVIKKMTETPFFSVEVDDTTDISQKSQCSIIVRYVNGTGDIVERFLGFHDVSEDKTANGLFELMDRILGNFNYRTKLVAQCYDGAAVMAGHLNGLQQKVKEVAPQAIFVHCLAHRLNLVLEQSAKNNSLNAELFLQTSMVFQPFFINRRKERTF